MLEINNNKIKIFEGGLLFWFFFKTYTFLKKVIIYFYYEKQNKPYIKEVFLS